MLRSFDPGELGHRSPPLLLPRPRWLLCFVPAEAHTPAPIPSCSQWYNAAASGHAQARLIRITGLGGRDKNAGPKDNEQRRLVGRGHGPASPVPTKAMRLRVLQVAPRSLGGFNRCPRELDRRVQPGQEIYIDTMRRRHTPPLDSRTPPEAIYSIMICHGRQMLQSQGWIGWGAESARGEDNNHQYNPQGL